MASCPFKKRLRNGHALHRQKKIKLLYAPDSLTMYLGPLFDSGQLIEVSNFLELLFSNTSICRTRVGAPTTFPVYTPAIMVCTGATGQESPEPPHCQPLLSLGLKQTKQKSLPHLQCMCLQASVCSISVPQNTHARMEGQSSTPPIFFLGESRRALRRLSSPEQSAFPKK